MVALDVAALFDAALALGDGDMLKPEVVALKERALSAERLVFDDIHSIEFYS